MRHTALLVFIFASLPVFACSCLKRSHSEYVNSCSTLFTATLVQASLMEKKDRYVTEIGTLSKPTRVLKGDPSTVQSIVNTRSGTSCDSHLMVGETYVVCGKGDAHVTLSACGLTHNVYSAEQFIQSVEESVKDSSQ